ncbi:MAG: hypothetical protein ABSC19_12995, partial [Syntrophorhabdales bacterium]
MLEAAVESDELDDESKFWTLDALAFWDWQSGERGEGYSGRLRQMESIIEKGTLGHRERLSLVMKKMTEAAIKSRAEEVEGAFLRAKTFLSGDPMLARLLRFNHAVALFHLGRYVDAEHEAELLYLEYYDVLGLDPADVVAVNPPEIIAKIHGDFEDHRDDFKHLADCLDLYAMSRHQRGLRSGLARLHAMKFFVMGGAYRSAVRVGQDAADELIGYRDPEGACQIMENQLLPLIRHFGLTESMVPVRAQYAVILAHCGRIREARDEMGRITPFAASLTPEAQSELL